MRDNSIKSFEQIVNTLEKELNVIGVSLASFDTPGEAINYLIQWNVDVAADHRVNGGLILVPVNAVVYTVGAAKVGLRHARAKNMPESLQWTNSIMTLQELLPPKTEF